MPLATDFHQFCDSLEKVEPPLDFSGELRALWLLRKGDWEAAHEIVQELSRPAAAWVHAHLHRCEGDFTNAKYWYKRAQKDYCDGPLDREWSELVKALL